MARPPPKKKPRRTQQRTAYRLRRHCLWPSWRSRWAFGCLGVWLHRAKLAILVTTKVWDAGFEWGSHEPPARAAGLADNIITALANDLEPELYAEAEQLLGKESLVDLIGVLGYYALISMTIKAFEVDPIRQ